MLLMFAFRNIALPIANAVLRTARQQPPSWEAIRLASPHGSCRNHVAYGDDAAGGDRRCGWRVGLGMRRADSVAA
jgi:hypothetical protein